ncbi:MAG TPA: hypothetical protein VKZ72_10410 [Acidimicrobiales bacterium]|nr:hypothetical protein [Acidimicrobiales bacterium]
MRTTRRPARPGRRAVARATLALLLTGAACASEADDAADLVVDIPGGDRAAFVREASQRTAETSYRIEMRISATGEVDDDSPVTARGATDGSSWYLSMDLGVMAEAMAEAFGPIPPGELDGLDATVEMAVVADSLYFRMPGAAELAADAGPSEAIQVLATLGDSWGVVDLAALRDALPADRAVEVAEIAGQSGPDTQALVEALQEVAGVEDLGTARVRGEPARGLAARLSFAELLEIEGTDPEAFAERLHGEDAEEALAAMREVTAPVEVWIDEDGYLVRTSYSLSAEELAEARGGELPPGCRRSRSPTRSTSSTTARPRSTSSRPPTPST